MPRVTGLGRSRARCHVRPSRAPPLGSQGSRGVGTSPGKWVLEGLEKVLTQAPDGAYFCLPTIHLESLSLFFTCPGLLGFSVTKQTLPGQTALVQEETKTLCGWTPGVPKIRAWQ